MNSIPRLVGLIGTLSLLFGGTGIAAGAASTKPVGTSLPATTATATAVFAGGCFWGVDAVFKHVKGVSDVVSGYAGGDAATAHYEQVSNGDTGHAESVRVRFDPAQVSLPAIAAGVLQRGARSDPTQPPGPGHRQPIPLGDLLHQPEQQKTAQDYIRQLTAARAFLRAHRHASRAAAAILSGRGVSPELSGTASLPALYRLQRHAQAGTFAQTIPRVVSISGSRASAIEEKVDGPHVSAHLRMPPPNGALEWQYQNAA